jgi:hypothetical protein
MHTKQSSPNVEEQRKKWCSWQPTTKICFLGYLAHVGAAVELKRKEKGGDKEL